MPTENRSSNTEMVSIPREHELKIRQTPLADLLSGLKTGEIRDCSDREFAVGDTVLLREIDDGLNFTGTFARQTITHVQKQYGLPDHLCVLSYGQPSTQPHAQPIAWMVGTAFWWTKEEAERDAAATGLPIVGLGPMTGAATAEQRQGESVALPERKPESTELSDVFVDASNEGWNACLDEIAKLGPLYTRPTQGEPVAWLREDGSDAWTAEKKNDAIAHNGTPGAAIAAKYTQPLYTHADPGEVERLREDLAKYIARANDFASKMQGAQGEAGALRDQLRVQDALLEEAYQHDIGTTLKRKIRAQRDALSASAEPEAKS